MSFSYFFQLRARSGCAALVLLGCWPVVAGAAGPLSLDQAVTIAEQQAPQLAAQIAAVNAAANEAIRAPQLPDPQLIAGVENLPVDGADRLSLTRDFMTMRKVGVEQMFPRREKRRLRGAAAEADVQKEEANLSTQRLDVRREAAAAWVERYIAERERDLLQQLRGESDLLVTTTQAALRGGKAGSADVLTASGDRVQLDDRIDIATRDIEQAQADLTRWVGADAATWTLDEAPDFAELRASPENLLSVDTHAALLAYTAMETRAQTDVELARAEKKPDWSVQVAYAQRGPAYSNMLSVEFRIDLPIFASHRQNPAIAAKLAQLDRVRAEREDAQREHREQTARSLAAWTMAKKRLARSRDELLPLARERVLATLARYRGGGDLQSVINARKAEIDANMTYLSQLDEMARAWVALSYLVADKE